MRRRLRLCVLFLTMGLVTTVVVALLLALLVDVEQGAQSTAQAFVDDEQWTVTRWDRAGAATIRSVRTRGGANWGPQQAAGPPNTPSLGDQVTAWASASPDAGPEWLILEYANAVIPRRVDVYETYAPGALAKVTVFDEAGAEHDAWAGVDPTKTANPTIGISQVPISLNVRTRRVKIHLASDQVPGWNEIDAVGLVSDTGEVQWAKRVRASTTYASGRYAASPSGQPELLAPPWTGLDQPTKALDEGTIAQEERQVDARGWPMLALWSMTDLSPKPVAGGAPAPPVTSLMLSDSIDTGFLSPPGMSGGLPASAATPPAARAVTAVPLRPIWAGLAVNTVFYGAIWAVLWATLLVPRRFIREVARFRRGACIACGYDLGYDFVAGCPECGWRRGAGDVMHDHGTAGPRAPSGPG